MPYIDTSNVNTAVTTLRKCHFVTVETGVLPITSKVQFKAWVSSQRVARFYYAARGHVCKLHALYILKNVSPVTLPRRSCTDRRQMADDFTRLNVGVSQKATTY